MRVVTTEAMGVEIATARVHVMDVHEQVTTHEPTIKYVEKVADWGIPKRQGKRGGGMVVGVMGAGGLSGKKVYRGMDLSEYFEVATDEEKVQFRLLAGGAAVNYVRARQFGLTHVEAMVYAKPKENSII